ncbi:cation:proton antiporter [Nocardia sp. NPDC050710]|uniref:cation:proton antiporter n=1 Tax=Nocardia sp. NPDC050710 TaxID=3157220 RepID=UPI0033D7F33B
MPSYLDLSMRFFVQMLVILAVYRLLWLVFKRLGQVQVVAIMVAGFVLGPSVLGAVWPSAQHWLFPSTVQVNGGTVPHPSLAVIYVVGQLGIVLYMFLVGSSFKVDILTEHVRVAGSTAVTGVGVPILLGGGLGVLLVSQGDYFTDKVATWQGALFLAAALSVTAFPVLAWIIHDSGLQNTRVGTMALSLAAFDDACAWLLLATVVASAKGDMSGSLIAFGGGLGFVLFMIIVGRRLLRPLNTWTSGERVGGIPVLPLVVVLLVLLTSAWLTDWAGIHSVLGAFVVGLVMPRGELLDAMRERIEPIVSYLLLPAFFIFAGLNTHLDLVFQPSVMVMLLVILVVSYVGKFGAVGLAARWQGMSWREAGSLGALANARGLMELILLNVGLTSGLITPALYTVLAIMTMVTTMAATPVFGLMERSAWKNGLVFGASGEAPPANEPNSEAVPVRP